MSQQANFFKLGLFIILSFCLLVAFLIAFGAGRFFKKEMLAETCFDESVQGLEIGSDVKYKGVKIGTVRTITTPSKFYHVPSNYVLVTFSLEEDCYVGQTGETAEIRLQKAIDQGLVVYLAFKGLTGAAYLETDYTDHKEDPLIIEWEPVNTYLPSQKSSFKRLGDTLNKFLDDISDVDLPQVAKNLESLIQGLNQQISGLDFAGMSADARTLIQEMGQTNAKISDFLTSDTLSQLITDAKDAVDGAKTIIGDARHPIRDSLENLTETIQSAKLMVDTLEKGFAPKAEGLATSLDKLLISLNNTTKLLETMVWLNADTIGQTMENLEHTSENLKQFSLDIRKYPGRLIFENPPDKTTPDKLKSLQGLEK